MAPAPTKAAAAPAKSAATPAKSSLAPAPTKVAAEPTKVVQAAPAKKKGKKKGKLQNSPSHGLFCPTIRPPVFYHLSFSILLLNHTGINDKWFVGCPNPNPYLSNPDALT